MHAFVRTAKWTWEFKLTLWTRWTAAYICRMLILVMGVAGSGKTLIGGMLAESLHCIFADADQFHPAANILKMARGMPLTDADREPWLFAMRRAIENWTKSGQTAVLACSALKQNYRDLLTAGVPATIVYLKGSPELIYSRLLQRHNHFMKPQMLPSQFADLEEPKAAIVIDIAHMPDQIVTEICRRLATHEAEAGLDQNQPLR